MAQGGMVVVLSVIQMESVVLAPSAGRLVRMGKRVKVVGVRACMLLAGMDGELSTSQSISW